MDAVLENYSRSPHDRDRSPVGSVPIDRGDVPLSSGVTPLGRLSPPSPRVTLLSSPAPAAALCSQARAAGQLEKYRRSPRQRHQSGENGAFSGRRAAPNDGAWKGTPPEEDDMADPRRLPDVLTSETLLLTPEEAAQVLRVGRTTLYALIQDGDLRPVHIGRSCRLSRAELERYVERLEAAAPAPPTRRDGRRSTPEVRSRMDTGAASETA
jgi:excisionase family DNA binding protein